jgi:hypothetical protein
MVADVDPVSLILLGLCLVVSIWIGLWLWFHGRSDKIDTPKGAPGDDFSSNIDDVDLETQLAPLRKNLLLKTLGNKGAVERLVERERERYPQGNLVTWHRMAIESWEQDNR